MKYKKIDYFKPLEQCSKEENDDGVSEYDTMIAISRLPDEFTHKQLQEEVQQVLCNRVLGDLVDKGLIDAVWDPTLQDVVFFPK